MIMQETIAIFLIIVVLQNAYGLQRTVNQDPGLVAEDDDENAVARDKYPESVKDEHDNKEDWQTPDGHNEASSRSSGMEKGLHHDVEAKDIPGREVEGEITITDPEGEHDTNSASVENGSIEKDGKVEQQQYGDSEMDKGSKRANEPINRDDVVDDHDDNPAENQDGPGIRRQQSEDSHSKEGMTRAMHDSDLGRRLNEEDEQISAVDHDLTTTDKVELEPPHIDDFQEESHSTGETRSGDYSSSHGQGNVESTGAKMSKSSYPDENDVKKSEQGREKTGFDERPNSSSGPRDEFQGKESFSKKEEMYAGQRGDSDISTHQRGEGYETKERSKTRYDGVEDRAGIHHMRHQYEPRKFHERGSHLNYVEKPVERSPGKPGRGERYEKRGKYGPQQKEAEDYDGETAQRGYGKEREGPAEGRSKLNVNDGRSWSLEQQTDEPKEQEKKEKNSEHASVYSDNEAKDGHQDLQGPYKTRTTERIRGSATLSPYPPNEDSRGRTAQRDNKRPAYERRKNTEHGRYGHAHYNGKQGAARRKKLKEYASPTKLFDLAENDVIKATQGNEFDALSDVKDDGLKLELENESLQTEVQTLQDEDQNVKDVLKGAEEYQEKEKSGPLATRDEMNGPYGAPENGSPDSTDDIKAILEHQEDQDPYGYFSSLHKNSEDDETGEKKQIVTRINNEKKTPPSLTKAIKTTINQLINKDILMDPSIATKQVATGNEKSGHKGSEKSETKPSVSKLDPETKRRQVQELLMKFFSDRNRTREFIRCAMQHRCEGLRQLGKKTSARVLNDSFPVNSDDEGSINLTRVTTKRNNESMYDDSVKEPQSTEAVNQNSPEKVYTTFNVTNNFNTVLEKNESKILHEVIADNKTINKSEGEDSLRHKQHLWEAKPNDNITKDTVISSNLPQPAKYAPKASLALHPFIMGTGRDNLESDPSTYTDKVLQLKSGKSQNISTFEDKSMDNTTTAENVTKAFLDEAMGNENITQSKEVFKNQSIPTENKVLDGGINNHAPGSKSPLPSNDSSLFSNDSDAINTSKKDKSPPIELVDEDEQSSDLDSGREAVVAQSSTNYNATGSNDTNVTSNETQDIGPYQSLRGTLRATVPRVTKRERKDFNQHEMKIIKKMYHQFTKPKHLYKLGNAFKRTILSIPKVITKRTMHHRGWHRHKQARNPFTRSGSKKDDLPEGLTGGSIIPIKITIKSVGCFDPPFHGSQCEDNVGSIIVNGAERSPGQQGFNFVIIDFKTGEVEKGISFNTHGDAGAHKKMSKLIESLGDWKIVAVAVKEDGKNYLPTSALDDMRKIGAKDLINNDLEYRAAYALVGFSGPADVRDKLPWIREEVSKAGKGPSVISVNLNAGLGPYKEYGGVVEEPKVISTGGDNQSQPESSKKPASEETGQNRDTKTRPTESQNTDAEYTGTGPNGSTEQAIFSKGASEQTPQFPHAATGSATGSQVASFGQQINNPALTPSRLPEAQPTEATLTQAEPQPSIISSAIAPPATAVARPLQQPQQQFLPLQGLSTPSVGAAPPNPGQKAISNFVSSQIPGTFASQVAPQHSLTTSLGLNDPPKPAALLPQALTMAAQSASITSQNQQMPQIGLAGSSQTTPSSGASFIPQQITADNAAKSLTTLSSNTPSVQTSKQQRTSLTPPVQTSSSLATSLPVTANLTGTNPQLQPQPQPQQLLPASNPSMDSSDLANVSVSQGGVQSITPAASGPQQGDPSVSQKINALMYNISTLQKMIEKNAVAQFSGLHSALTNETNIKTASSQKTESASPETSQDTTSLLPSASSLSENVKAAWKNSKNDNQQLNDNSFKALVGNVSGDSQPVEPDKNLLITHSPFADLTDVQNMQLQQQGIISHFSNPAAVGATDAMGVSDSSNNYANAVQALTSPLELRHDMGKTSALTDTPESNVNKLVALADALGYGKDATNPDTPGGVTALNKLLAIADALGMSAANPIEKTPSKPVVPSLYNTVPSKLLKGTGLKISNAKPLNPAAKLITENSHLKGSPESSSDSGLQSALDELSRVNEEANEANDNSQASNGSPTSELAQTGDEAADSRTDDPDATVEGQITTALSTLGIPDAAASGIASLMSPSILSTKKDKREKGQKIGLAAKLAKSIADLGGRGAASAAGVASLAELLMNAGDVSVSQATDKLGQALQKVGGAGAAVGYAALASALKDPASSANAGALVGNLIMALAEQGSAPGTAGLAAFAAGLGGSGADALAGGLGGSLENLPAGEGAKIAPINTDTGNAVAANDKGQLASTPPDTGAGVEITNPTAANSPSQSKSPNDKATLEGLGGEVEVHTGNTDSEYTGQGPIGSREQGGFFEIGLGTGKNNPLANLAVSLLQNAQAGNGRTKTDDSNPVKNCNQQDVPCHDADKQKGLAAVGNEDRSTEAKQEEPAKPHGNDPLRLFSTADLGLIGNSLGSVVPPSPKKEAFKEDKFSRRCTARCKDQSKQVGLLIELKSTSKSATIKVNERDLSKDEPGFNIVVIDFSTGEVEATENFDTENDGGASKAMANFLVSLRPGKIILVASKGDASNNMEPSAYDALNNCGGHILKTSLLQKGDKYVLLGFKGPDVDWTREVLAEAGGGTALLSMPLMIGPAALKNESLCLQICKHNEESGVLLPQGQENFSEEDTYADIGSSRKAMGGSDVALKRNKQVENEAPVGNGAEVSGYSKFVVLPVRGKHRDYQPDETEQEVSDALDPDDMNEQLDQKVQALERERQKAQRLNKDTKPLKKQQQKHKTGQKKKIISKLKKKASSEPDKEDAVSSLKVKPTKKVKGQKTSPEIETPQILNASVIDFSEFDKVLQGYSKDNPLAEKAILLNYDIGTGDLNPKGIGFPPNEGLDFPTGGHKGEDSHTPAPPPPPNQVSSSTKFAGGEIVKVRNESSSNVSHQTEPKKSWTTVSDLKNDKNKKGNSSEGALSLGAVFKSTKKESTEEKLQDINEKSYSEIGDLLYSRSDQPRPLQIQVVEPRSKITHAFGKKHLNRRKNLTHRTKKS